MYVSRRDFLKSSLGGVAAMAVGGATGALFTAPAHAHDMPQSFNFHITDALKGMVTDNPGNPAKCYFWVFKEDNFPADCPGPIILTTFGSTITVTVTNDLTQPHAFFVPGMIDSGPIAPGQTWTGSFMVNKAGTFMYYDNLNAPVNRVMGLHGALIVMPHAPAGPGHKMTPYLNPTPFVQRLFDDLGTAAWWPGLAWEEGDMDAVNHQVPFRQYVWLMHQASPVLFAEVGANAGVYDANLFMDKFLRSPFSHNRGTGNAEYFTINGQSGHFAHNTPFICPMNRIGEPSVVRILNAGLWCHSTHIHANHVFVIGVNGAASKNPIWVDTFTSHPMDTYEWVIPYMRPPDIPNTRGIGRQDPGLTTLAGGKTYPPVEELGLMFPAPGERMAQDQQGNPIDLKVEMSPLCFPMHDHSEASQTAQGGNYNCGLICGINFTGDRNTPGGVTPFPGMMSELAHHFHGLQHTEAPTGDPGIAEHGV